MDFTVKTIRGPASRLLDQTSVSTEGCPGRFLRRSRLARISKGPRSAALCRRSRLPLRRSTKGRSGANAWSCFGVATDGSTWAARRGAAADFFEGVTTGFVNILIIVLILANSVQTSKTKVIYLFFGSYVPHLRNHPSWLCRFTTPPTINKVGA